jgi:lipid A disaccharide synthetase
LIQDEVTGERIFETASNLLRSPELLKKQTDGFNRIKSNLGKHKASETAAKIILHET